MAIKSREDLMSALQQIIGDRTDDEAIQFVADVSDTINDYETRVDINLDEELKKKDDEIAQKVKEKDEEWRIKYRNTFFNGGKLENNKEDEDEDEDDVEPTSFEELFKEEG